MKTDARVRRSREKVLGTTFDLLEEAGVGGISVDEIARRSGVAKTTIYRHWPSREELILDACSQITAEPDIPDTGDLDGDLSTILTEIARLLESARWAAVVPSIVDAAEHDPRFAEVHARIQHGHAEPLRAVLERATERGELDPGVDRQAVVASLLGPLFYRRWFSREPIDERFVAEVVASGSAWSARR